MSKTKRAETDKRSRKLTNDILEDHGDYLVVDVSTDKLPDARMLIDKPDYILIKKSGYGRIGASLEGKRNRYPYAKFGRKGHSKTVHRFLLPDSVCVDHKNHNGLDNRRSNIRSVTVAENALNQHNRFESKAYKLYVKLNGTGEGYKSSRDKVKLACRICGSERTRELRVALQLKDPTICALCLRIEQNSLLGDMVGVSWHKAVRKWQAKINFGGKNMHLGYFDNIDIAIGARKQAERELFGKYSLKESE